MDKVYIYVCIMFCICVFILVVEKDKIGWLYICGRI